MRAVSVEARGRRPVVSVREDSPKRKDGQQIFQLLEWSMEGFHGVPQSKASTMTARESTRHRVTNDPIRTATANGTRRHERNCYSQRAGFISKNRLLGQRNRQQISIHQDNLKLVKRIVQQPQSKYSVERMRREWRRNRDILTRLSNYPRIIEPRCKSSMANRKQEIAAVELPTRPLFSSNKLYESSSKVVFNGKEYYVHVRLDKHCLRITATREEQKKVIEVERGQAIEIIQQQCGGELIGLFPKLRYDGESIYLMCEEAEQAPLRPREKNYLYSRMFDMEISQLKSKVEKLRKLQPN